MGTNELTMNWLRSGGTPRGSVGIVMADFPGAGLIEAIIARNAHLPISCARSVLSAGAWWGTAWVGG
jgi:hypothetical protein